MRAFLLILVFCAVFGFATEATAQLPPVSEFDQETTAPGDKSIIAPDAEGAAITVTHVYKWNPTENAWKPTPYEITNNGTSSPKINLGLPPAQGERYRVLADKNDDDDADSLVPAHKIPLNSAIR